MYVWKSCQGYFHISSWCVEEQPAASQKPQEQDRESSPYFHSVLQGRIFESTPISGYVFQLKGKIGLISYYVLLIILASWHSWLLRKTKHYIIDNLVNPGAV